MTLIDFVTRVKSDLKNIESLYNGLTIVNLSLPNFDMKSKKIYNNNIYLDASHNKQSIKLLLPISVLKIAIESNHTINENVSVDITIDTLTIDTNGTILIRISKIIESGISEQELFIKSLTEYCNENNLFNRKKRVLPTLIKKIALISTINTNTLEDILSKLDYTLETSSFKVNNSSDTIAQQINDCQNGNYDLILLYRGGHKDMNMNIYSGIPVLKAIHNSTIHIGTALGHEIDIPFVYSIADSTYSTPTNFAQVINKYNSDVSKKFQSCISNITHHMNVFKNRIQKDFDNCKWDNLNILADKLDSSLQLNIQKVYNQSDKILHTKNNALVNTSNSINSNVDSMITNVKNSLFLSNRNIESLTIDAVNICSSSLDKNINAIDYLLIKSTQSHNTNLNDLYSSINKNTALLLNKTYTDLTRINKQCSNTSDMIISRMNNNLLAVNGNIQSALNKIELKITNDKNKKTNIALMIILTIVILIAIALLIK